MALAVWLPAADSRIISTAFGGLASMESSAITRTVPAASGLHVPSEVYWGR